MAGTTRTRRSTSAGRFARSTSAPRKTNRVQARRRRRRPEPSGLGKVMGAVLPTAAARKATPGSKKGKAGGLALAAAATGLAFMNRGKLSQKRRKFHPAA